MIFFLFIAYKSGHDYKEGKEWRSIVGSLLFTMMFFFVSKYVLGDNSYVKYTFTTLNGIFLANNCIKNASMLGKAMSTDELERYMVDLLFVERLCPRIIDGIIQKEFAIKDFIDEHERSDSSDKNLYYPKLYRFLSENNGDKVEFYLECSKKENECFVEIERLLLFSEERSVPLVDSLDDARWFPILGNVIELLKKKGALIFSLSEMGGQNASSACSVSGCGVSPSPSFSSSSATSLLQLSPASEKEEGVQSQLVSDEILRSLNISFSVASILVDIMVYNSVCANSPELEDRTISA